MLHDPTHSERDVNGDFDTVRVKKRSGYFGVVQPVHFFLPDTLAATASSFTVPFFIADRNYEILRFRLRYVTAAAAGSGVYLKKAADGVTVASGDNVLQTYVPLDGTAATIYNGTLNEDRTRQFLRQDEVLGLDSTGNVAALNGFMSSVWLKAI